ncbi:MAG: SDR family oxidoreductase [Taibaiella sp.]|nr:SDR family oxidoreductase [Taibaiella sp.]
MKYAVITGASQGIGYAITEKLLSEGYSVAICARTEAKLLAVAEDWRSKYPPSKVIAIAADLSSRDGVNSFAAEVLHSFPHIDVLVNNTGTFKPGTIASEPEGQLENMISTNLYSAYNLTRRLLPTMQDRGGHIFNMCSVASLKAYPNGGAYSISKYALLGFSDNLREELREHSIKVTSVCPGAVWSPSWEGSGVAPERIMEATDVAAVLWNALSLSAQAVTETIIMRPIKGDL